MRFNKPLLLLLTLAPLLMAFRVKPMVVDFRPTGPEATQSFVVENTNSEKIAVKVEQFTRSADNAGHEIREATEKFTIYPRQLSLSPNEKRNIRVSWTGEKSLAKEESFRIIFTQLPVDLQKQEALKANVKLNFLLQYVASVYVGPPNTRAKLTASVSAGTDSKKLSLKIHNTGTAHKLLKDVVIKLLADDGSKRSWSVSGTDIKKLESENLLSGQEKTYVIDNPAPASVSLKALIESE
jgi:fimbrial chaperone protein